MAQKIVIIEAEPEKPTVIREDNLSAIAIAKNPITHARTKHIDIKFHFVREALSNGCTELIFCPTEQMVADVLTKPLSRDRFERFRLEMGLTQCQVNLSGSVVE